MVSAEERRGEFKTLVIQIKAVCSNGMELFKMPVSAYTVPQFSSVAQSCPTLCDPMGCSTPGLPVHHQLPELAQIHVHRVVMPSNHLILRRPLLLPSIFPSIRVFSTDSVLHIRWPKSIVSALASVLAKNTHD